MSDLEKQEFKNRLNALSEDERVLALKTIPSEMLWDELKRRDTLNRETIANISKIVGVE